jgi:lipoic acid synthetase
VSRFYHPEEFVELAALGRDLGFAHVESGPLVRSSYHAKRQADAAGTGVAGSEPIVAGAEPPPSISGHPRLEPASRQPLQ